MGAGRSDGGSIRALLTRSDRLVGLPVLGFLKAIRANPDRAPRMPARTV